MTKKIAIRLVKYITNYNYLLTKTDRNLISTTLDNTILYFQGKSDDTIKVEGSKEGIEKAMYKMKLISDDQVSDC